MWAKIKWLLHIKLNLVTFSVFLSSYLLWYREWIWISFCMRSTVMKWIVFAKFVLYLRSYDNIQYWNHENEIVIYQGLDVFILMHTNCSSCYKNWPWTAVNTIFCFFDQANSVIILTNILLWLVMLLRVKNIKQDFVGLRRQERHIPLSVMASVMCQFLFTIVVFSHHCASRW